MEKYNKKQPCVLSICQVLKLKAQLFLFTPACPPLNLYTDKTLKAEETIRTW